MADGQVVFELTADGTKAKAEIDSLIKAFKEAGIDLDKDADKTSKGIESKFVSAFKKISIAAVAMKVGKALLDFGKDAIQAASDLEEVQNVVDVTFGDDAAKIEKWAKEAGTQFGLTETQAKKFTSTLGAMMKSAGLAGPEIVDMSTDLAGLAADMASFYNLDFEEAFQKIRSGISGETEPLKQLGINMSVANLEAFALTQGIDKAFSEMTQGEQTMLRYQYLMQATADAQGDFARTSDGYANAVRTLETNIASLKTSVGEVILPIISSFVSDINNLISAITTEKPDTVLDDFAAIDLDTAKKMAEIEATANKAADLVTVLEGIQGDVDTLSRTTIDIGDWSSVLDVLDKFGEFDMPTDAGQSIANLADALNGNDPNTDRATAWQELLAALSTDIDSLSKLTGKSPEETKQWLEEIAAAANQLDPNSADGWSELFGMLTEGLPGLTDTNMAGVFGILAGDSENAARYLEALGFDAEEVADAHEQWLRVCRQLVNTIPGLNEIINTETGEVKGGIGAITDYYTEWKDTQEKILKGRAYYAKQAAIQKKREELYDLQLEAELEQIEANRIKGEMAKKYGSFENLESMAKRSGAMSGYASSGWGGFHADSEAEADYNKWLDANNEAIETSEELIRQQEDLATAEKNLAAYGEENADVLEAYQEAASGAADATAELTEEQKTAINTALTEYTEALDAVNKYAEAVWEDTRKNIDSVADGFGKITTPAEQAREEMEKLDAEIKKGGDNVEDYKKQWTGLNDSLPTIQNMTEGIEDQLQYWRDYLDAMKAAREAGVSEDILAMLSDGSVESFDYLTALAKGDGDIEELNSKYAELVSLKEEAATELSNTRLNADDEFQSLVAAANAAAEGLDVYPQAESAMESTVQGIIDGLAAKIPEVEAQVAALNKALEGINTPAFRFFNPTFKFDGSHAMGLDYVPFNGYLAQLHEGESVLTAEEARVWRDFKNAGASVANTIDYEAMGGVMRDNIRPGGNVYLDGNIVGRVVSDRQGNALRQLERSGWQR